MKIYIQMATVQQKIIKQEIDKNNISLYVKMSNNDIEEKNEKLNIQEIFENARKDPTLFSTMKTNIMFT
jgi:hypothetical protein